MISKLIHLTGCGYSLSWLLWVVTSKEPILILLHSDTIFFVLGFFYTSLEIAIITWHFHGSDK